jgi:hypothetical protein
VTVRRSPETSLDDREPLTVGATSPEPVLAAAAERLADGGGVVVLEGTLILRSVGTLLLCDVIDPMPATRKCENEFGVLVENARRTLEGSRLRVHLPDRPLRWRVVEVHGADLVELWRAP